MLLSCLALILYHQVCLPECAAVHQLMHLHHAQQMAQALQQCGPQAVQWLSLHRELVSRFESVLLAHLQRPQLCKQNTCWVAWSKGQQRGTGHIEVACVCVFFSAGTVTCLTCMILKQHSLSCLDQLSASNCSLELLVLVCYVKLYTNPIVSATSMPSASSKSSHKEQGLLMCAPSMYRPKSWTSPTSLAAESFTHISLVRTAFLSTHNHRLMLIWIRQAMSSARACWVWQEPIQTL